MTESSCDQEGLACGLREVLRGLEAMCAWRRGGQTRQADERLDRHRPALKGPLGVGRGKGEEVVHQADQALTLTAHIGQRFGAVLGAYGQLAAKQFDVALVLYPISGHRQAGIATTAQYQCSASHSRLPSFAKSSWRRNKVTEAISHVTEDHLPYQ
jgi:hypothetical protein